MRPVSFADTSYLVSHSIKQTVSTLSEGSMLYRQPHRAELRTFWYSQYGSESWFVGMAERKKANSIVLETYIADTADSETNEHICARIGDANVSIRSEDDQATTHT